MWGELGAALGVRWVVNVDGWLGGLMYNTIGEFCYQENARYVV